MKFDAAHRWALALLALVSSCAAEVQHAPGELVLVVLVDTLRRDALGCYGNPRGITPHLDALAVEGVRFERAIAASGWTLPSAASLLTGVSPLVHKAGGKGTTLRAISPDVPTGAEIASDAGWRTVAATNAAFINPLLGLTRGFDSLSHRHAYNRELRRADESVDWMLGALEEHEGRDTLALLHLFDAHLDYDPPPEFVPERLDWQPLGHGDCTMLRFGEVGEVVDEDHRARVVEAYEAEVRFIDEEIGRLIEGLKRHGLWKRTTLIVTADHGEEFWEHGGFEHGHSLYEELVQVPLIVRFPPRDGFAPRVVSEQVRSIDVQPTLFERMGLEAPATFEGRSLMSLVRGERDAARVAHSGSTLYGGEQAALRRDGFTYILKGAQGAELAKEELYDRSSDPGETRNVIAEHPVRAGRMRADLMRIRSELAAKGARLSDGRVENLSPRERKEYLRRLASLGYLEED